MTELTLRREVKELHPFKGLELDSGQTVSNSDNENTKQLAPKLVVLTACDDRYFKYAAILVRSMDATSPGAMCNLHLINPSREIAESALRLARDVRSIDLSVSAEATILDSLSQEDRRTYFASARFLRARDLLEQSNINLLVLDSDCIVVNPIDGDFTDKPKPDVCILRRYAEGQEVDERLAVANGAVFIVANQRTRVFLRRLSDAIERELNSGEMPWFIDQELVYRQLISADPPMRVYNIKRKYIDWTFDSDAVIWTAKGRSKNEDIRYLLATLSLSENRKDRHAAAAVRKALAPVLDTKPGWLDILERYMLYARLEYETRLSQWLNRARGGRPRRTSG